MQNRKMAGRFAVLPFEVIDILEELKPSAERLYVSLVRHHVIQEDWELPGEWVQGTLRATKTHVIRESHIGSGTFWNSAWPDLVNAELAIDNQDGTLSLPKLKKKIDASVSPAEIQQHGTRLNRLEEVVFGCESPAGEGPESARKAPDSGAFCADSGAFSRAHPLNRSRREEIYEEEEEQSCIPAKSQEKTAPPGSRRWIMEQADRLWPGRGYKPVVDDPQIAQLESFPADRLDEAFQAARKAKVKRGNYDWLLNRLQSPERYIPGRRRARSKKLEWDPDIGRLNADWLDQEEG